jgi:drug/metabolite transporter (DMT)-like permease
VSSPNAKTPGHHTGTLAIRWDAFAVFAGLFFAALASVLFNAAVLLQAMEAREVPSEHGLRLSLLGCLVRRPRWLGGIGLSVAAVSLQILALTLAPLTVVQPADAAGLMLLLVVGSRVLGEQVGRRELTAVAGIVVGIIAIAAAAPSRSAEHTSPGGLVAGLLVVGAIAATPYVVRRRAGVQGLAVVFGAGFAFAAAAFSIKLVADALDSGSWLVLGLVAGVAAIGGAAGMLSEQTALQHRQATQVAPIIFVVELVVPLMLAIAVGGESWGASLRSRCSISAGIGLLIVSVVALMQTPAVSQLLAGGEQPRHANRAAYDLGFSRCLR